MSEALSIEYFSPGYEPMNPFVPSGTASSSEAIALSEKTAEVVSNFEQSEALFGEKSAAIMQLRTLANECADQNWDGYDARAIAPQAVLMAEDFVRALPQGVALPEFAPEPDGSISLDWIHSRSRLFSTSVGGSNRLAFTWLDGTDKGHGVAYFDGGTIPPRILEGINAIVNDRNASVRIA